MVKGGKGKGPATLVIRVAGPLGLTVSVSAHAYLAILAK
ncbi:hypothetical protein BACT_0886 [Bifidobacterium actinocoloniiforme DSM 22766]|uniref:Uncharacterized protein n=1 Tax=Bifidobacterium actinocoloniiforme DSM 22766 TaxID=1437605 RepID=A0A086Z0Y4_9BIFI|nr:hypothetical protein BACT_0886 [Bifidobacterium actinocoloniiforme DSM 22766]